MRIPNDHKLLESAREIWCVWKKQKKQKDDSYIMWRAAQAGLCQIEKGEGSYSLYGMECSEYNFYQA